jgi:glucosylceramidase
MPAGQTDPNLDHFSIDREKTDLIPLLKEILAISPYISIIATPWTPPVWMKDSASSIGRSLKPEFYKAYANYFVKYIKAMEAEGIKITAITPQNEPLNPGNNPSLLMTAAEQRDFIKKNLGPAFRVASIDTKIIVYDHNCDKPDYPLTILNDIGAKVFVDGSAFHLYAGDIGAMSQVRLAHPDKKVYFTEQYTSTGGTFAGDLNWHLKNLVIGAPRNWSSTVFELNLANDVNFGHHTPRGCTTCKGALTIDGGAVKRNVAYYILAHISKFVLPGCKRIYSNIPGNIQNVVFKNNLPEKIVVVLNDNDGEATFKISVGNRFATATLPGKAVATYVFR